MTERGRTKILAGILILIGSGATRVHAQTLTTLLSFSGTNGQYLGQYPYGDLTISGSVLYGMTIQGGASGDGNIFSVGIDGTNYQNLLNFSGSNGQYPQGT